MATTPDAMIRSVLTLSLISLITLFPLGSRAETADELQALISACADGEMMICDQINELNRPSTPSSPLDAMALAFADRAPSFGIEQDAVPDLGKAYDLIVRDYFTNESISEENRQKWFREAALDNCAQHYHTRWRYEKAWWPVTEENTPDWRTIYPHALDHYFGFCVAQ